MSFLKKLIKNILTPHKLVEDWLSPNVDEPGVQIEKEGSDHKIRVIYGTAVVPPIKVLRQLTDSPGGPKNDTLHLICIFAEGECDGIEWIELDGVMETSNKIRNYIDIERYLGADDQPHCAALTEHFSAWTADHKLSGLCYAYVRLKMDKDRKVWNSEPRIRAKIRGRKVIDFRTNERLFSANPALCQYDYLTNTRFGKAMDASRIDLPSFTAAAQIFDQEVEYQATVQQCEFDPELKKVLCSPSTTETRTAPMLSCNTVIDTAQSILSNTKQIATGCRGLMPMSEGVIKLIPENSGVMVYQFDSSNIIGKVTSNAGRSANRYNQVTIRFNSIDKKGEADEVTYPEVDSSTDLLWLHEDNGKRLKYSHNCQTVNNKAEALMMAQIIANRSRFGGTCSFKGMPETIIVEPGDIVGVTCDIRGWIQRPFRVSDIVIGIDGENKFTLREHNDAIYPWSDIAYTDVYQGSFLGDPTSIEPPTNLKIERDPELEKTGRLTWKGPNDAFLAGFLIVISDSTDQESILELETISTGNDYVDIRRLPIGKYRIDVYAKTTIGRSEPATLNIDIESPSKPTHIELVAGNFEIECKPIAILGFTGQFEFGISETDDIETMEVKAVAKQFTFTPLKPNTTYFFWCRVVTINGNSDWLKSSTTTTKERDDIIDVIGPISYDDLAPDVTDVVDRVKPGGEVWQNLADINQALGDISNSQDQIDEDQTNIDSQLDDISGQIDDIQNQSTNTTAAVYDALVDVLALASQSTEQVIIDQAYKDEIAGFTQSVNEQLGQIIISGGQIDFSEFKSLQVLVDTHNARFTSLATWQTQTDESLVQYQTKLDQTAHDLSLLVQSTELADWTQRFNQVELTLDGLNNAITSRAMSAESGNIDSLLALLQSTNEIPVQAEQQFSIAFAQERITATTEAGEATAEKLSQFVATTENGLAVIESKQKVLSNGTESLAESTNNLLAQYSNQQASINTLTQSLANETTARATEYSNIQAQITTSNSLISANTVRLNQVEVDIAGNASAITAVTGSVNNELTGLGATYAIAQSAKTTADGAAQSYTTLNNTVSSLDATVTANHNFTISVSTDLSDLTTAFWQLDGTIKNSNYGLTATYNLAQSAKTTADGAMNSATQITNKVNHATTGLDAIALIANTAKITADGAALVTAGFSGTVQGVSDNADAAYNLAQTAKIAADGAASSYTLISNKVNHPETGLDAVASVANSAKLTADGAAQVIGGFSGTLQSVADNANAAYTLAGSAKTTADGAMSTAVSANSWVQNNQGNVAQALITLDTHTNNIGELFARAFIGVDLNGRVTGLDINGNTQTLSFYGLGVNFINANTGQADIYWNAEENRWVVNAILQAIDIRGDVNDSKDKLIQYTEFPSNDTTFKIILSGSIPASPLKRRLIVHPFQMRGPHRTDYTPMIDLRLAATGGYQAVQHVINGSTLSPMLSVPLNINEPVVFNLTARMDTINATGTIDIPVNTRALVSVIVDNQTITFD